MHIFLVDVSTRITLLTRLSEMANTSPRHMPVLARVFIFLIDGATQEIPIKKYLKEIVFPVFEIYAIEWLGSMSAYVTFLSGVH